MSDRQSTFIWLDIYKKGRQRDRIIGFLALVLVTHGEATPFKLGPQDILNFFSNKGDHGRAGLLELLLLLLLAGGELLLPPPPDGGDIARVPLHCRCCRARLVVEGSNYG